MSFRAVFGMRDILVRISHHRFVQNAIFDVKFILSVAIQHRICAGRHVANGPYGNDDIVRHAGDDVVDELFVAGVLAKSAANTGNEYS